MGRGDQQIILNSIASPQYMLSVHIKLIYINLYVCIHYSPIAHCYGPCGDQQKLSNFIAGHHDLSSAHMMHHSSNTDAWTHSWKYYSPCSHFHMFYGPCGGQPDCW